MNNRCSSCGAPKTDNQTQCPYCKMRYNDFSLIEVNSQDKSLQNVSNSTSIEEVDVKRPKINWLVFIILLNIYVFPAFIYLVAVLAKQREWDLNNGNKNREF